MDPFTQRMMERAKNRREKLDCETAAVGQAEAKRRRTPLLENNPMIITTSPNRNHNIVKSSEEKPKPELVASPSKPSSSTQGYGKENSIDENEKPSDVSNDNLRSRLNRLGKLYAGPDNLDTLSSPVHKRTETLSRYTTESGNTAQPRVKSSARTARLAALAHKIEEWEDDLTNLTSASNDFPVAQMPQSTSRAPVMSCQGQLGSPVKPAGIISSPTKAVVRSPSRNQVNSQSRPAVNSPSRAVFGAPTKATVSSPVRLAPQPPPSTSLASPRGVQMGARALQTNSSPVRVTSVVKKATKTLVWDKAVIATLEAQGFVATESRSRLVYDYEGRSPYLQEEDQQQQEVRMKVTGGDGLKAHSQDYQDEDEDEGEAGLYSPAATGSVSSPGWVYQAGSPIKRPDAGLPRRSPKMGLQSPVKKIIASSQLGTPSPVKSTGQTQSPSPLKSRSPTKLPPRDNKNMSPAGSVLHRAAMFESAVINSGSPSKDPAELPLLQRMALFEKNKSQTPLLPKVAFSTPLPAKLMPKDAYKSGLQAQPKPLEAKDVPKKDFQQTKAAPASAAGMSKVLAQKAMFEKSVQQPPKPTEVVAASLSERQQELEMLRNRWDKQKQLAGTPGSAVKTTPHHERHDLEHMRNRWETETQKHTESKRQPETPPPPPMPSASYSSKAVSSCKAASPTKASPTKASPTKPYPVLETVRKIRLSPPKEGRMYPCLSDIDATESEMDADTSGSTQHSGETSSSDDNNTSFGAEILQAAGLHRDKTPLKRVANEMTPSECAVLDDIDEFLDEAMGSDSESVGPTPPKKYRDVEQAESFQFRTPATREVKTPAQQTPIPSYVVESGQTMPLMHTVSFYRKQQAEGSRNATPVKQVTRLPDSDDSSDESATSDREQREVHRKICKLSEEVSKQQTVISQTSQALNLCRSTVEFSNSAEQVAAERLLLIATNKRQALLHEIQRLKVEGTLHAHGDHTETGSLTISNLALPLKKEFLARARRTDGEAPGNPKPSPRPHLLTSYVSWASLSRRKPPSNSKHSLDDAEQFVVCLVRCQEHVLASTMLATSSVPPQQDTLRFPGSLTLQDLSSDFAIKLEVYTLQARRETISHEDKYHIKKDANKHRLTPKKPKHDSVLVMPVVQSPAGPSAVRSPSFMLAGYTVFSLREINRTHFTLNKVPFASPLEGHIGMQMTCELHLDTEQRGFLTMFEDISGFGAWHRRWCVLDGARLAFWKYPDDERKKEPIGWIDLACSSSKQVGPVSRDVCARPNTFLLETRRQPHPDDSESMVMILGQQYTTIRHLLSADTREERIQWCSELSRALVSMRAWRSSHSAKSACVATSL